MRVVVFSSTSFGARCIAEGVATVRGVELAGILGTPQRVRLAAGESRRISTHFDFAPLAARRGWPLALVDGPEEASGCTARVRGWRPELILVLGWYFKVPREIRELAERGCLGIHASLLPKYRGGAPIPWAIIQGETRTGVTLFHLDDELDAGDVVAQSAFAIEADDTCATVYAKAEAASIDILKQTLPALADGTAPRRPQDSAEATWFPQRRPEDGLIDWSWDARRLRNFIRAQTHPYPGAFYYQGGEKVTVWNASSVVASGAGSNEQSEGMTKRRP
jgi:methionyl-tRNA formyltransferase